MSERKESVFAYLCFAMPKPMFALLCLKKSLEGKVPFSMQQKVLSNLLNNTF